MSGGSFDYLYSKSASELMNRTADIGDMADELMRLGYEPEARDVLRLYEYVRSAKIRIEVLKEQLEDVMHDVEWYESCDIGEETLKETIEKYRRGEKS